MAAPGLSFNRTVTTGESVESAIQTLVGGLSGTTEYSVTSAGANTLILTRRFTPTWAVVVGVLGILLFLIGILAFFIKETETLTITVSETEGRTRILASGVGSNEMTARLNAILTALEQGRPAQDAVFLAWYQGGRYILGEGPGYYGIWDREAPSQPIHQFVKTPPGWQVARSQFARLEPTERREVNAPLASVLGTRGVVPPPQPAIGRGSADVVADPGAGVPAEATKTCPECAETVKKAARVCRFCGHRFAPPAPKARPRAKKPASATRTSRTPKNR